MSSLTCFVKWDREKKNQISSSAFFLSSNVRGLRSPEIYSSWFPKTHSIDCIYFNLQCSTFYQYFGIFWYSATAFAPLFVWYVTVLTFKISYLTDNCIRQKLVFFFSTYFLFWFIELSQRAHNVKMTPYQCRCDVITSHRRWYDVILMLCACWDMLVVS